MEEKLIFFKMGFMVRSFSSNDLYRSIFTGGFRLTEVDREDFGASILNDFSSDPPTII